MATPVAIPEIVAIVYQYLHGAQDCQSCMLVSRLWYDALANQHWRHFIWPRWTPPPPSLLTADAFDDRLPLLRVQCIRELTIHDQVNFDALVAAGLTNLKKLCLIINDSKHRRTLGPQFFRQTRGTEIDKQDVMEINLTPLQLFLAKNHQSLLSLEIRGFKCVLILGHLVRVLPENGSSTLKCLILGTVHLEGASLGQLLIKCPGLEKLEFCPRYIDKDFRVSLPVLVPSLTPLSLEPTTTTTATTSSPSPRPPKTTPFRSTVKCLYLSRTGIRMDMLLKLLSYFPHLSWLDIRLGPIADDTDTDMFKVLDIHFALISRL